MGKVHMKCENVLASLFLQGTSLISQAHSRASIPYWGLRTDVLLMTSLHTQHAAQGSKGSWTIFGSRDSGSSQYMTSN